MDGAIERVARLALALAFAFAWALACAPARPESTMTLQIDAEARNRALVLASFAAWRDGTGSPFDVLADDATWTIVGHSDASRTYASRAAFLAEVIAPFNARMRVPLRPTIRNLYVDGDTVIVFFDASGVARDGQPYENTYAWFWELRDGRVIRAYAFFDSVVFNDLWRRVAPDRTR